MTNTLPQLPLVEPVYNKTRPFPIILPLYQHSLPNAPGKCILCLKVTFPPNASTPPHRHAGAFVVATVIKGSVLNKMNNEPMEIFHEGGSFNEMPGCHHRISDNASATEEAVILVNFIIETEVLDRVGVEGIVEIDKEYC